MALQTTAIVNADWRLVDKSGNIGEPGYTIRRQVPFLDAPQAVTATTGFLAVIEAEGPYTFGGAAPFYVDGVSQAGVWVNSKVVGDEGIDDQNQRYVNLIQTAIKVTTVSDEDDLTNPLVVPQENKILNFEGINTGEQDIVALEYRNLNPSIASQAAFFNISDANIEDLADAQATGPDTPVWVYLDRTWNSDPNGTATARAIFKISTWTKTWADAIEMDESSASGYRHRERLQATGISGANMGAAYTAAQTASAGTKIVVGVQQTERANGERVVTSTEKPKNTSTDITGMVVTRIVDALGRQDAACVRSWWNHDSASTLTMTTTTGVAVTGFTYDSITYLHSGVTNQDNGDGTFNIHQMGSIPSSSASGFWGNDSGYGWFAYHRKRDEKLVAVEHLRTDTIADAYSFARGGTISTHSLAQLKTDVNAAFDPDWTGTPTVIGSDEGNQTGSFRRGKGMYMAIRVVADSTDLPIT